VKAFERPLVAFGRRSTARPGFRLFRSGARGDLDGHVAIVTGASRGIGLEVARWIAERKATLFASDTWTGEVVPNPDPTLMFPVHQELLTKNGIFILENLKLEELAADGGYEFLFVFAPVPFKGATGSPGRPIAIR